MKYKPKPTLYFFGSVEELYAEIQGDWIFENNVHRLKHKGKNRITWHPTTGAFLFQGGQHISDLLYDATQCEVLSKEKFACRTKYDLEHYQTKINSHPESMRVEMGCEVAPSEAPWD
ncbi:MAG: hypothetical protein ACSHXY_10695 [Alphaproteobacteria bacterium]